METHVSLSAKWNLITMAHERCPHPKTQCSHVHASTLWRLTVSVSSFFGADIGADDWCAADEGGATHMSGGIPWLTLPAGYLGSSLIGAALIVCGFDTNASKVACLVLAGFFLFTLWWARREIL